MSEYCLPDVQNKVQLRGNGAGEWGGYQDNHWEDLPPKNQHKVCLPRLDPLKVASTGDGNGGALCEGSGSALIKPWKQLSRSQGKARPEPGFDRQLSEPLNVHRNRGAGLMVDSVAAIDVDRGEEEPENLSQVQCEVNHIRSKGSNGEREQEAFREHNGLSRMEGNQFPISVTDEMDTASDYDVDGGDLRQKEDRDNREGFTQEPCASGEEITTGRSSRSITPELTPVLFEESDNAMVTQGVQTAQKTAELETAGDKEKNPQRPEEQKESSIRELSLEVATLLPGPDTTGRDEEDAATAEVYLETDVWRSEEQMEGEQGWRIYPVQEVQEEQEEEEEEKAGEGPSERGMGLQEMLEDEKEPSLKPSHEGDGSPPMGKSSTV